MERQTITRRIAGLDREVVVCQLKGGYGCKHKRCNGTAKTNGGSFKTGTAKMFKCQDCGKLTHYSDNVSLTTRLCRDCYDDAGMENEHADGYHDWQANPECKDCQVEYAESLRLVPSTEAMQALTEAKAEAEHATSIMHHDPGYIAVCECTAGKEFLHSEYPLARIAAEAWVRAHMEQVS